MNIQKNIKMRNLFYFPLEAVKNRYTLQLSDIWMPEAFKTQKDLNIIIVGNVGNEEEISEGVVLDATRRGIFSMIQCTEFLTMVSKGIVKNDDIIFLQDFWTPGIEAIFYALDLYNIKIKLYSMLHAQSVDEYDFMYKMKDWARHFELGISKKHSGIFVGSTIHREQLKAIGINCPIHVLSLPLHYENVKNNVKIIKKENQILFSSRLDNEKNPYFLYEFIKKILNETTDWNIVITTSANDIKSNLGQEIIDKLKSLQNDRFKIKTNLTKKEYYSELAKSKIQFNCSLQDYVSWTLLEALSYECLPLYPEFRSFPEILSNEFLYKAFDLSKCFEKFKEIKNLNFKNTNLSEIPIKSDIARLFEVYIMKNDITTEFNIWHEFEKIKSLLNE